MQYAWLPDNTNWKVKYVVKDYRNDEYEAGCLSSSFNMYYLCHCQY
jgi:hypothetical protein